jgi:G protein-coupled receptor Mth (Methuselah protein)
MIFSLPFLLITFCVYGFIPELRNVHGKSLMCYVFALMVMYIGWCIVHLESSDAFYSGSFSCVFIGYMIYISIYVCFFWLNVMCFDIFNTFRGGLKSRGSDKKKFLFYCLYAFGIPLVITCLVLSFDKLDFFSVEYQPQIGIGRCWIQSSKLVEAMYVYIPISIIIAVNVAFYSITAFKIFQVQKETSVVRNGESQRHGKNEADKDRQVEDSGAPTEINDKFSRFFLYLRLFIVMGASWSMESISWFLDNRFYSFYISDIINSLQGFIIFILFVWKPKVRDLIRQRLLCHCVSVIDVFALTLLEAFDGIALKLH